LLYEFLAPDQHWHGGNIESIEGVKNYADVYATEHNVVAEGDKVAMRFVVKGTHEGTLWGIPAIANRVAWDALMVYRLVDTKIVEQWLGRRESDDGRAER